MKTMSILVVGNLNQGTRSQQRFLALKEMRHQVVGLGTTLMGYYPEITDNTVSFESKIITKIFDKLGYPLDTLKLNKRFLDLQKHYRFDLIWVEKALALRPETISIAKRFNPTTIFAFYSEDDMYARHNQSWYFVKSLPLFDFVFTTKSYNTNPNELQALGAKRVIFVDKAYDVHLHRPMNLTTEDRIKWGATVSFIGSFEVDRAQKMLFLSQNTIKVRIWGNSWSSWVSRHPNLIVENRPIYGDDYIKALCATKVNLCFLRKVNRDLQTDRTMEIPACGAFMLAERTQEHERLFKDKEEAVFFNANNPTELLEKCRYYIDHEEERQKIALAGRQRCLSSGYDHINRLKHMLNIVIKKQHDSHSS